MALTHKMTKRVDLPHEPDAWIEARMPSLVIKDRAREMRSKRAISMMEGIDLSKLQGLTATERDDSDVYDPMTLMQSCIVAWSYPDPVTAENIAELDDETVEVVRRALLPVETEADRKNGSGGSMTASKVAALPRKSG